MRSAPDSDLLPRRQCAKCQADVGAKDRFCQQCGAPASLTCSSCGSDLDPSTFACTRCGQVAAFAARLAQVAQIESPWAAVLRQLQSGLANEFEILRELGRGGQAAVFLAREISLNRLVAIKVLAPGTLTTASALERFRREAMTIAALSHPNIVTIFAVRQIGDLPLFIMQYLGGKSLQRVLADEKRLSPEIALGVLHQVASALAFAHRRGVIHRDVKPGNVLFDEDGNAVVTDFGIAKDLSSETQTETGTVIGTPAYMSPEQCYGRGVTSASDQYSLGIMTYEMLTGGVPFSGAVYEIMRGHTDVQIERVRKSVACSKELDEGIARMVRKKPDERWPSLSHVLQSVHASAPPAEGPLRDELRRMTRRESDIHFARPVSGEARRVQSDPGSLFAIRGPDEVEVGDRASFSLSALRRGLTPPEASAWSVSNEAIVGVEARSGELVARSVGTALVRAVTALGVLERTIVVTEPKPVSLELHLPTTLLEEGESVRSRAVLLDKRGHAIPHAITLQSSNAAVASLSADGELRALSSGVAIISAEAPPLRTEKRVEVAAPRVVRLTVVAPANLRVGDKTQLRVDAFDRRGNVIAVSRPSWASENPRIASVTAQGAIVARTPGHARLAVAVDGVVESCGIQVLEPRATLIRIERAPERLVVGKSIKLAPLCFDDRGEVVSRPVQWSTSTSSLVDLKSAGTVRARRAGVACIIAKADAAVAEIEIVVTPAPPKVRPLGAAIDRASRTLHRHRRTLVTSGAAVLAVIALVVVAKQIGFTDSSATLSVTASTGTSSNDSTATPPVSTSPAQLATRDSVPAATIDSTMRLFMLGLPDRRLEPHQRFHVSAVTMRAGKRTSVRAEEVAWRSDDEAVVRFDAQSSELVAVGPGRARVTAAIEGAITSVELVVVPSRVANTLVDDLSRLQPGDSQKLGAVIVDHMQKPLTPDSARIASVIPRPPVAAPVTARPVDSPAIRRSPAPPEPVSTAEAERRAAEFVQLFPSKAVQQLENLLAGSAEQRRGIGCLARVPRVSVEETRLTAPPTVAGDSVTLQMSSRIRWSTNFSRHDGVLELDVTYGRRGDAWRVLWYTMKRPLSFC